MTDEPTLGADDICGERLLLSDAIRNTLIDEIASGVLKPGSGLDEQHLADRFSASRTPVREALRQLAVTGLVEMRPRRGVIVTQLTPERIMDMFETMAEIEALCVRLATYRITPLERSRLIELQESSYVIAERGDVDAYDRFNRAFHEALYDATHNTFLVEQATAIRMRLTAFRRAQLRQDERIKQSQAEHSGIMQAIAEGDGDTAARRMRAHMMNAARAIDKYISTQTR